MVIETNGTGIITVHDQNFPTSKENKDYFDLRTRKGRIEFLEHTHFLEYVRRCCEVLMAEKSLSEHPDLQKFLSVNPLIVYKVFLEVLRTERHSIVLTPENFSVSFSLLFPERKMKELRKKKNQSRITRVEIMWEKFLFSVGLRT